MPASKAYEIAELPLISCNSLLFWESYEADENRVHFFFLEATNYLLRQLRK